MKTRLIFPLFVLCSLAMPVSVQAQLLPEGVDVDKLEGLSDYEKSMIKCTQGLFPRLNPNDIAAGKKPDPSLYMWGDDKQAAVDKCMKAKGYQVDYGRPATADDDVMPAGAKAYDPEADQKKLLDMGVKPTPPPAAPSQPSAIITPVAPLPAPETPVVTPPETPAPAKPDKPSLFVPQNKDEGTGNSGKGGGLFVPQ